MSEVQVSYETRAYRYQCDVCGKGEMVGNGVQLLSNPPKYPSICTECGFTTNLLHSYPRTETVIGKIGEPLWIGIDMGSPEGDIGTPKRRPGRPPKNA